MNNTIVNDSKVVFFTHGLEYGSGVAILDARPTAPLLIKILGETVNSIVFLDKRILYSTMWNLTFFMTLINAASIQVYKKTHSVFCLLFCCSTNLNDITPLQTFH